MAGHVKHVSDDIAHMAKMINAYKFWTECLKGTDHSKDKGINGMTTLKLILHKQAVDWFNLA
jgi:hypothetical protein